MKCGYCRDRHKDGSERGKNLLGRDKGKHVKLCACFCAQGCASDKTQDQLETSRRRACLADPHSTLLLGITSVRVCLADPEDKSDEKFVRATVHEDTLISPTKYSHLCNA